MSHLSLMGTLVQHHHTMGELGVVQICFNTVHPSLFSGQKKRTKLKPQEKILSHFVITLTLTFILVTWSPSLSATDNHDLFSHVPVTVQVLDVNDNPPEIAADEELIVCESSRAGQVGDEDQEKSVDHLEWSLVYLLSFVLVYFFTGFFFCLFVSFFNTSLRDNENPFWGVITQLLSVNWHTSMLMLLLRNVTLRSIIICCLLALNFLCCVSFQYLWWR